MKGISRRDFVFLSSGATVGNLLVSGVEAADGASGGVDFSHSGLVTGQPKPLKHKSIPGFLSTK